jgi:hypothetical protein
MLVGENSDISEEHISSIFRAKPGETVDKLSLAYSPTLKMVEISKFETSGPLKTTQPYNPEDCTLHSHRRENLVSNAESWLFTVTKQ